MATQPALNVAVLCRIDEICLQFDTAWRLAIKAGQAPPLPPYADDGLDLTATTQLLRELVAIDIEYLLSLSDTPTLAAYLEARWSPSLPASEIHHRIAACRQMLAAPEFHTHSDGEPLAAFRSDWQPGTLLSQRYRIGQLLGKGGMGAVFLAHDQVLDKPVALKVLRLSDPNLLRREILLAQQVNHPHVCRVYHLDVSTGTPFLLMEYVAGQSLDKLLRQTGRLTEARAAQLAAQLCWGLQAVHDKQVLHRDLKPGNVLIDEQGDAHLSDFGLACLSHDERATDGGTIAYMSPEQLSGGDVTNASDIYALGLMLFELYTGRRLFTHTDRAAALTERQNLNLADERDFFQLPPQVRNTIADCLQSDPQDRPQTPRDVHHMLNDRLESLHEIARRVSERTWNRQIAIGCYGLIIASLVVIVALADSVTLLGHARPMRPEISQHTAATLLRARGFPTPVDWSAGYISRSGGYDVPPGRIFFAYRESPALLVPNHFFPIDYRLWPSFTVGMVTGDNPSPVQPGMVNVWLDERGGLVRLRVVPGANVTTPFQLEAWTPHLPAACQALDWTPIVDADQVAPLDIAYDKVAGFKGTSEDGPPWHLTIAEHRGQLTYLDCTPQASAESATIEAPRKSPSVGTELYMTLLFVALLVALRNIWLGYCDHASAIKVAIAVFLIALVGHYLVAHHVWSASELDILETGLAISLYLGFVAWIAYVAIEPFVRRHLPEAFISWGRLLAGRPGDSLIGRDLLVGIALATFSMALSHAALTWSSSTPLFFEGVTSGLIDQRTFVGLVCVWCSFTTALSMLMLVSLVSARRFLPLWAARAASVLLWTIPFMTPFAAPSLLNFGLTIVLTTLTILVLENFGFLPIVICWLARALLLGPLTAVINSWHWPLSATIVLLLIAAATYGLYSSTRRARAVSVQTAVSL